MKVLVTGHAGFIGSHIAERLVGDGHEVWGLDSRASGVDYAPRGLAFDGICDLRAYRKGGAFELPRFDRVIHCAAKADIRHNWEPGQSREILGQNVDATAALLEAMNEWGGCPIVFLSTAAVGISQSLYAVSKKFGEAMCRVYTAHWGAGCRVLRLARVVGPRYHHGHIADFVRRAKAEGKRFRAAGPPTRASAVHVLDVVEAAVGGLDRGPTGSVGLDVASEETWSAEDTARLMGLEVSWPERGWEGDCAPVVGPWPPAKRRVEDGVRAALAHLGWSCAH